MFFNGIQLPESVRISLEQGNLVIFAGAGVSSPSPANLPLFNTLASKICGGCSVPKGKEDQFLDEYKRKYGTDVHSSAAHILYNSETQPTDLHRHIVQLFGTQSKVRIVTTNFDNHFSVAARNVFRNNALREFHAPALPLGDDFSGLVYLHGSAKVDPRSLILTQRDFGEAYLTRGWAKDFLVPLFSRFDVLFVGYSHSDVTMTYLASGLNRSQIKQRWAFVPSNVSSDASSHWEHLGITLIHYPIDSQSTINPHQPLTSFFCEWMHIQNENILQKAKRMQFLGRQLPPQGDAEKSYIKHCLETPQLAKSLCDNIKHSSWVGWFEENGYLDSLFPDKEPQLLSAPAYQDALFSLICSKIRRLYPDVFLDLLRKNQGRLSENFIGTFSWYLSREQKQKPDPRFSTWISIILSFSGRRTLGITNGSLLLACLLPNHLDVALLLFEELSTPRISFEESWDLSILKTQSKKDAKSRRTTTRLAVDWPEFSDHHLRESWERIFNPHLSLCAKPLAQIAEKQLIQAHLLLGGGKIEGIDRFTISWMRSSIASGEQNHSSSQPELSCLIDILRDCLSHLVITDSAWAIAQASRWISSEIPLMERFAVYTYSIVPEFTADQRIEWLIRNKLIFHLATKAEVFAALKIAYPYASNLIRKKLLKEVKTKTKLRQGVTPNVRTQNYEAFNVLIWLKHADSTCLLVKDAIAKIKAIFPDFAERNSPDLNISYSEARFVDPAEGIDFLAITSQEVSCYLKIILTDTSPNRRNSWLYLENLKELFLLDRIWGERFMQELANTKGIEPTEERRLWRATFPAWNDAIITEEDWLWFFPVIEALPRTASLYAGVVDLLCTKFCRNNETSLPDEIVKRAARLVDIAWMLCSVIESKADDIHQDWLTSAINDEGGEIGQFWIHYCDRLHSKSGEEWNGIPIQLKANMTEALKTKRRTGTYARIAMTRYAARFFIWDKDFYMKYIMPLFDWDQDPVIAQQTWAVYLSYVELITEEHETTLLPFYQQCAERCGQFSENALKTLGFILSNIAISLPANPVESGFFRNFLPPVTVTVRSAMMTAIGEHLKQADALKRRKLWNSWLKQYTDLRLVGAPVALESDEAKSMIEWPFYLEEAFPEMVERVLKMPLKNIYANRVIEPLLGSNHLDRFPKEACRLAVAALNAETHTYLQEELKTLHEQLKERIPGSLEIQTLEELFFLRGWNI